MTKILQKKYKCDYLLVKLIKNDNIMRGTTMPIRIIYILSTRYSELLNTLKESVSFKLLEFLLELTILPALIISIIFAFHVFGG